MSRRRIQWSDLPKELLAAIGKRLDTRTDVLRFRAICSSWRSSIPPFPANSPSFPIKLPFPIVPDAFFKNRPIYFTLTESTVYRLESPQETSQSSISSKGWLVKVEESRPGKMHLLNPLSKDQIKHLPYTFPKVLNCLGYQFFELCKAYTLQYVNGDTRISVDKAIFSSNFGCTTMDDCDCAVLVIYSGELALWKLGAEEWTLLGEQSPTYYTDIILYKGQFHAIDRWGEVVVINSSLNLTKISSPIDDGYGRRKYLVESCGDLYVVYRCHNMTMDCRNMMDLKVYKLNYEVKHNWVEVKSLGDQVLFLGEDCSFFVSAQDITGFKGNCIYFMDENFFHSSEDDDDNVLKGLRGHSLGVFNLEDRRIGKHWEACIFSWLLSDKLGTAKTKLFSLLSVRHQELCGICREHGNSNI